LDRAFYVYILTNRRNGTLYVGVTSDLIRRVYQHRMGEVPGFTSKHGLKRLVYYEQCGYGVAAVEHEKRVKRWRRAWKLRLIEEQNPQWRDLWDDITG
jgi:putative endonuclease